MTEPNQDIRITKTQKALSTALMNLLEKNTFSKISVNDICQEALVSRSTFYVHFEDKYMLLKYCLKELSQKLGDCALNGNLKEMLHSTLEKVYEHSKIFRNIFLSETDHELRNMFREHFGQIFEELLVKKEREGTVLKGPIKLLSLYYSSGISGMVAWWIEHNFPVPSSELASCQYELLKDLVPEKMPECQR